MGYKEIKLKNYFKQYKEGKVDHKSITANYKTPDGYIFEIQWHTDASLNARNKKVPLYEEIRQINPKSKRGLEIVSEMRKLAEEVNDPKEIYSIKEKSPKK